jgi:hypothetical protein
MPGPMQWIVDSLDGQHVIRTGVALAGGGVRLIDDAQRTLDLPASMVHGTVTQAAGPDAAKVTMRPAVVAGSSSGPAPTSALARSDGSGVRVGTVAPAVPAPPALSRATDPATSRMAAATVDVLSDRELVLRAHREAGDAGLTGEELATVTGRRYESVGPRRPGLVADGLLFKVPGVRRANSRGNMQDVYYYKEQDQ